MYCKCHMHDINSQSGTVKFNRKCAGAKSRFVYNFQPTNINTTIGKILLNPKTDFILFIY